MAKRGTIAVDWDDTCTAPGSKDNVMLPGAVKMIKAFQRADLEVKIFSCRAGYPAGRRTIEDALAAAGVRNVGVTLEKPQAWAYIDNRGVRFDGDFDKARREAIALVNAG